MEVDYAILHQELMLALDKECAFTQEFHLKDSPMRGMLQYHYETGGKRLRPFLVWALLQELNPKFDWKQKSLPFALAVELIHNATLIHDDIQDGDEFRRTKPTLWKKYSMAQAMNCGDAWFFIPLLNLWSDQVELPLQVELQKLLQKGTLAVIEGQAREFELKEKFVRGLMPTQSEYEQMVKGKTSPLFSIPLLGAAKIAGVSAGMLNDIEKRSALLGEAFQIQDDLIDLWGQKGRERRGSDIAEGKLSFPLILLLSKLQGENTLHQQVCQIISKPRNATSDIEVAFVIEVMEKYGVLDEALERFNGIIRELKASTELPELTRYLVNWLSGSVSGLSH